MPEPSDAFLEVRGLQKRYAGVIALEDVSLQLARGTMLAVAGLSGSGKTTLARCLAGFETPDAGTVLLEGRPPARTAIQLIFQDAAASLNPRFTAADVVAEPLLIQHRGTGASRREEAARCLELVGLPAGALGKRALAFSGGERQRLAIARALAIHPQILILDESLSGLDVALQEQLTALLRSLNTTLGLTCILITHDLALAARIASEIAIMDSGRLIEHGPTVQVTTRPQHLRTRELLDAACALSLSGALR